VLAQQSLSVWQFSPDREQMQVFDDASHAPVQQSPSVWQPASAVAQPQVELTHWPPQQLDASTQDCPSSLQMFEHVFDVGSQRRLPQQSESDSQLVPVPRQPHCSVFTSHSDAPQQSLSSKHVPPTAWQEPPSAPVSAPPSTPPSEPSPPPGLTQVNELWSQRSTPQQSSSSRQSPPVPAHASAHVPKSQKTEQQSPSLLHA
jgi:hypothetical protein